MNHDDFGAIALLAVYGILIIFGVLFGRKKRNIDYLNSEAVLNSDIARLNAEDIDVQAKILHLEQQLDSLLYQKQNTSIFSRNRSWLSSRISSTSAQLNGFRDRLDKIRKEKELLSSRLKKITRQREKQEQKDNKPVQNGFSFFLKKLSISILAGIASAVILFAVGMGESEIYRVSIGGLIGISVYVLSSNWT